MYRHNPTHFLKMTDDPNVILIDARTDNKPSGSKSYKAFGRLAVRFSNSNGVVVLFLQKNYN